MTKELFNRFAKQGKTVVSMDFVEGRDGMCTTGVSGNPRIYLDQIARKLGFIMLQLQSGSSQNENIPKIIDAVADNAKLYYAKLAKMYLEKETNNDKTDK